MGVFFPTTPLITQQKAPKKTGIFVTEYAAHQKLQQSPPDTDEDQDAYCLAHREGIIPQFYTTKIATPQSDTRSFTPEELEIRRTTFVGYDLPRKSTVLVDIFPLLNIQLPPRIQEMLRARFPKMRITSDHLLQGNLTLNDTPYRVVQHPHGGFLLIHEDERSHHQPRPNGAAQDETLPRFTATGNQNLGWRASNSHR